MKPNFLSPLNLGIFTVLWVLVSCGAPGAKGGLNLKDAGDLQDKRIGVLVGSVYEKYTQEHFPNAIGVYLDTRPDLVLAIKNNKCDGAYFPYDVIPTILEQNSEIGILEENLMSEDLGFGFNHNNPALRESFNEFLDELRASGELAAIYERWVNDFQNTPAPVLGGDGSGGLIRLGTTGIDIPNSAIRDGELAGYDIDIFYRFASKHNLKVEVQKILFGGLIAALSSGKVDVIGSSIMITEERGKQVAFSDPYAIKRVAMLALKKNIASYAGENSGQNYLKNAGDLKDKRIGILVGSIYEPYVKEHYPNAVGVYIDTVSDAVLALKNNKCDGVLFADTVIPAILEQQPDIGILEEKLISDTLGFGFNHNNPALRESFNEFLRELRAGGELAAIYERWTNDFQNTPVPALLGDGSGGLIRFGTTGIDIPNSAIRDGELVGYDIDIFYRFASKHNLKVEVQKILFGGLIAALSAGKVDVIASSISITEERAKQIAFSEPYAGENSSMLALKKNIAAYAGEETGPVKQEFWAGLKQSFENNLIAEKRYMLIVKGLWVTLLISLFSALLGTVLGGLICFLRMSKNKFCNGFANVYIAILRGTPILVLLMIMFYVIFAKVGINAQVVAVIAFAMNFAAYVSEMFRTAIEGVNKGQTEAGIAMGFTKVSTFIHIVLPQAVRRVMPVYKGEFISLVKMTSVVGYIAVEDLTKASDIIRSRTFDAFFPLVLVAIIYFLLSWLCTVLLSGIETSTDPRQRKGNL